MTKASFNIMQNDKKSNKLHKEGDMDMNAARKKLGAQFTEKEGQRLIDGEKKRKARKKLGAQLTEKEGSKYTSIQDLRNRYKDLKAKGK